MGNLITYIQENCCICIYSKKINKSNLLLDNIINDIEKINNYEIETMNNLLKIKKVLNKKYNCC